MYPIVNFDSAVKDKEREPWEIILYIFMTWPGTQGKILSKKDTWVES